MLVQEPDSILTPEWLFMCFCPCLVVERLHCDNRGQTGARKCPDVQCRRGSTDVKELLTSPKPNMEKKTQNHKKTNPKANIFDTKPNS